MPTDPLTASRYPAASAAPNVAADIQNAVWDLADNTVPHFTSTASRDSAYTSWVSGGGAMRDGLWCTVGTKLYEYVAAASAWVEMGDAGATTTFTPTWTAANGAPSLGNGTLTGRYRKVGRMCWFNIILTFGGTTNGGLGPMSFGALPFTSANYEQEVLAKASTQAGVLRNWSGFGYIPSGTTTVAPFFSNNGSPVYWEQARNADSGGAAGTGVPFVSAAFAFNPNSNLVVQGLYETTS